MTWGDAFWWPHEVSIRDLQGAGSHGDVFAAARSGVPAEVIDQTRMVRAADGREVVSSTRVTVAGSPPVPLGSLVTVWPGGAHEREARVLQVGYSEDAPPLPTHQVLFLE